MSEDREDRAEIYAAPEFSRPVPVARIESAPKDFAIEASEAECAALAIRFGLETLDRLEARVRLKRIGREDIRLEAVLSADVVQNCVVTLAPLPGTVEESFSLIFRPGIDDAAADQLALENPDDEIVEPLDGDSIDIGEAVAQQLSVALDPFPRAKGVELPGDAMTEALPDGIVLEGEEEMDKQGSDGDHPFAVLKDLKKH
ncbi:MAG TPA: DUF177 domain-containing protein [Stellaceae bacterium]|nr:DUF177 domain-containing protein [Stellaceae bacterium]